MVTPRHSSRIVASVFAACALVLPFAAGASAAAPRQTASTKPTMTAVTAPSTAARAANGRIAFSGDAGPGFDPGGHSQVFTVNPDGTDVRQLTHVPAGSQAGDPGVSADGRRIAYVSNVTGNFGVWVMRADGSGQHQIAAASGIGYYHPRWSPDGRHIVVSRCDVHFGFPAFCDIDVMRPDGSRRQKLVGGHRVNADPEYSPNGKRIVFDSDRAGFQSAIWVVHSDGTGLKRLTRPAIEAFWPNWSPDGGRIVFSSNCCRPANQVFVMRADGTHVRQLTHFTGGTSGLFASYSPNGRRIVLVSNLPDGSSLHLYTMWADGSHLRRIVADHPDVLMSDWGSVR